MKRARRDDPRRVPLYTIPDAARILRMSPATLRSWVLGRPYEVAAGSRRFQPLIRLDGPDDRLLSFTNLVEAHVLFTLRRTHGVRMDEVRRALVYAERKLDIPRLLVHSGLKTTAGNLFVDRLGELLNLGRSGQLAIRSVLEKHLNRLDYARDRLAERYHPFLPGNESDSASRLIVIDPAVAYGRPTLAGRGITIAALTDRFQAGESMADLAEDYRLEIHEIEAAIRFEHAIERPAA